MFIFFLGGGAQCIVTENLKTEDNQLISWQPNWQHYIVNIMTVTPRHVAAD